MEFRKFSDIKRFTQNVTITEKIHGSNFQLYIFEYTSTNGISHETRIGLRAGSSTRIITPGDDNYGSADWADKNKDELIEKLGLGLHFGEWYGSSINSGYGMTKGEKKLALFDQRFKDKPLPAGVITVPVLYSGPYYEGVVKETMAKLKEGGSVAAPGFMRPEGVVIRFESNGAMFKHVFEAEETGWSGRDPNKEKKVNTADFDQDEVNKLLQPIRLEKLLSRDERYLREYPKSLVSIVKDYVQDMEKEDQLSDVVPRTENAWRAQMFLWVKLQMKERGYST